MGPERTASGIGQLVNQLCKSKKLPEDWEPAQLVALIGAYTKLVRAIANQGQNQAGGDQDPFLNGRPNAYNDMVKRAKELDAVRKGRKTLR